MTNFYALDTETTGFNSNEPIQIAAVIFENGKLVKCYNKYFNAEAPITHDAFKTHGLDMW